MARFQARTQQGCMPCWVLPKIGFIGPSFWPNGGMWLALGRHGAPITRGTVVFHPVQAAEGCRSMVRLVQGQTSAGSKCVLYVHVQGTFMDVHTKVHFPRFCPAELDVTSGLSQLTGLKSFMHFTCLCLRFFTSPKFVRCFFLTSGLHEKKSVQNSDRT